MAGPNRLICNIRKSPMFSLFLSLPGSDGCGHRRLPPTLGRASGLRVSSVVCHSTGAGEAPGVSGDGAHPDSSLLASASVVSRPPSPVAGPSGCSAPSSQPPAPASVSQPLPGSPQASPSCLETLRRFTRAAGFSSSVACLSYVPQFVAKSESLTRSIPRSFLVKSLSDFAAGLDDDLLLCPVRALRIYLDRISSLSPLRHRLFVSPRRPTRPLSKNAVSFFLRDVISSAGASRPEVGRLRAHDIRGVSTSVAFHRNWSVSTVLESATWSSSSVFSSFYLLDLQHEYNGLLSLGSFVAAGTRIG